MTKRQKNFKEIRSPVPLNEIARTAKVALPPNAASMTTANLSRSLGKGFDLWVMSFVGQLQAFIDGKSASPASVVSYVKALRYFVAFLEETGGPVTPLGLLPIHIIAYIAWLKARTGLSDVSRGNVYSCTKSVLLAMSERGAIAHNDSLFPQNPFARTNCQKKGATPLSAEERSRLAEALRRDIIALHNQNFAGRDGQAVTVYALALGLRTGLNTTALLELARDSMQPHPFMPRMRLIRAFKRRGNATHIKALRHHKNVQVSASVPMDGVALFEAALTHTLRLVQDASPDIKERVWLYRSASIHTAGRICCLTQSAFTHNVKTFIARHRLLADDGKALVLNTSRLRKTMENRLWQLSNGDLFTVASIMGHTPAVSDQHYLRVTDEMRRNAALVGESLVETFRSGGVVNAPRRPEPTPVGNCSDTLNGQRAPRNGTHCTDFLSCFTCRSFAITGSAEDLHRLFSFYWFLEGEGRSTRSREWAEHFLALRTQIDAFTLDKFDEQLVEATKESARVRPLKFWSQHASGRQT